MKRAEFVEKLCQSLRIASDFDETFNEIRFMASRTSSEVIELRRKVLELPRRAMQVVLIPVEGEIRIEEIDDRSDALVLDGLQRLVGGPIEHVRLLENVSLWVNEEGRICVPPLPVNKRVSDLLVDLKGAPEGYILGPVLVAGLEGPTTITPPAEILKIAETQSLDHLLL